MRHLANAQYWDRPAGGNTGRLFLAFGGPVCADRFSNCPLDRVLTYKNLIYLLNLQFSKVVLFSSFHSRIVAMQEAWFSAISIFSCRMMYNKTTGAVCISRRALKGRKYLFRDIHNFSFSAKIQDDIFSPRHRILLYYPMGPKFARNCSVTILKIFSMFIFC